MDNRVAVVTGASSGIGRATAVQLAKADWDVLVHARTNDEGAQKTAELIRLAGRECHVMLQDFGKTDALEGFVNDCWSWKNRVDVWVNNAGADVLTGDQTALDFAAKLNVVLQVDVVATMILSRAIANLMTPVFEQTGRRGCIVNIGWDQAATGMAGDSGEMFAASKGAIMATSKSLAQSLAPSVRVNCVAPGWIQTAWGQEASETWQTRAVNDSLLQRWGTPDDVAAVVKFLASTDAVFINGQVICVNGGFRFSKD